MTPEAEALVAQHQPDIVIFGHSHVCGEQHSDGIWYINPGSAGPARFKLKRTAMFLLLPEKASGSAPRLQRINLAAKAPPRLWACHEKMRKRAAVAHKREGEQPDVESG